MTRITKTQAKRLINDIESKARKLFNSPRAGKGGFPVTCTIKDMEAIQRMCDRWMKRLG